jgi:CubicO group peptidase (beta-lactamase class C family)
MRVRGRRLVARVSDTPWCGPPIGALGIAGLAMVGSFAAPLAAQEPVTRLGAPAPELRRGPSDAVEVGAFLDGLMAAHLSDHDIVGATVAVVRDGQVLFSKGYGYADKETRASVDPEKTLFRVGSVSKLFTWTAVMQQVEEGKLDLDADVRDYIDFDIPETFDDPITLTHLLTHTPGFEDRSLGLFGSTDLSRGDYLAANMPTRVRPPGVFSAYSNYGTALAGHIVERVSGMSWEDYVDERIMKPLGMEYATASHQLPDRLRPHMSVGYANEGGDVTQKDFEVIGWAAPAGSVSASAESMSRFMIAHLQDGEYEGTRILGEETARRMHQRVFEHDDRLPGIAYGFYEQNSHGLRMIGHGGDTQWFHTNLTLIPDEDVGVFVSYNTAAGGLLSFRPFLQAFLDHYYPVEGTPVDAAVGAGDLGRYAGVYRMNRMSFSTFEKVMGLIAPVKIGADEGGLVVQSPLGDAHFASVGSGLFEEVDGTDRLSFREDGAGRVTHAFLGSVPIMTFERVGTLQSPGFHLTLLGLALAVFVITFVALPVRLILRRKFPEIRAYTAPERRARVIAWFVALINLAFVLGFVTLASDSAALIEGSTGGLSFVLTFGVLGALLTVGVAVYAVLAWKNGLWTRWGRVRYTAFATCAVAFVLVLNYWNLIGWRLG